MRSCLRSKHLYRSSDPLRCIPTNQFLVVCYALFVDSPKISETEVPVNTCISAIQHLRPLRGGAQAHLLKASDGACYVTKFQNNPQHIRVLANEMLATNRTHRRPPNQSGWRQDSVPEWQAIRIPVCRLRESLQ